jgi:ACS family hexuronate transporter-like MFS transporter
MSRTPIDIAVSSAPNLRGQGVVVAATRVGHYRWWICGLLFLASSINYVDRQVIGILKPTLQQQFGWSEVDYGNIVMAFQAAYALGLAVVGRWIDRIGTRCRVRSRHYRLERGGDGARRRRLVRRQPRIAPARSRRHRQRVGSRLHGRPLALGLGEAANFPAGIKAIAEWFPRRERALAAGLFNAGTNIGALDGAAPGSRGSRSRSAGSGHSWPPARSDSRWLLLWLGAYRPPAEHPRVEGVRAGAHPQRFRRKRRCGFRGSRCSRHRPDVGVRRRQVHHRSVWWLYIFWIPDFLHRNYGLDLSTIGPPLVVIFLAADAGSVAGGWLSSHLIARGWSVNAARKTTMLTFALLVLPVGHGRAHHRSLDGRRHHRAGGGGPSGLVVEPVHPDLRPVPAQAVASVVGLGGMAGSISGILIAGVTAGDSAMDRSYVPIFAIASVAYLVALACLHLLSPRLAPARL